MNEIWKAIPGYEGIYEASTAGRIRSVARTIMNKTKNGKDRPCVLKSVVLSPFLTKLSARNILPRMQVVLSVGGKTKSQLVHVLIAKTFIENPLNVDTVNHKDGNPTNNSVDNLEWVSKADNQRHAFKNNLVHTQKPVAQLNADTGEVIAVYPGIAEAMRRVGVVHITRAIQLGYKAGGFKWRYVDLENEPVTTIESWIGFNK